MTPNEIATAVLCAAFGAGAGVGVNAGFYLWAYSRRGWGWWMLGGGLCWCGVCLAALAHT